MCDGGAQVVREARSTANPRAARARETSASSLFRVRQMLQSVLESQQTYASQFTSCRHILSLSLSLSLSLLLALSQFRICHHADQG